MKSVFNNPAPRMVINARTTREEIDAWIDSLDTSELDKLIEGVKQVGEVYEGKRYPC